MSGTRNLGASVRQRLLNRARVEKRPFQELLQFYAMERFLYRLSQSRHSECFVLKGALMLRVWESPSYRPTMDIDMLGITDNREQAILQQIEEVIAEEVADGLLFDTTSLKAETITEDADYQGLRVRFPASLDGARIMMQLDIGFGDAVYPGPERQIYPVLLDFPAPELLCYSRESAIAEKLQAMIVLGELNSRMKDFFDIWLLARRFDFSAGPMKQAILNTFSTRGTTLPDRLPFNQHFIESKQKQWEAFRRRIDQEHIPSDFDEIARVLYTFLSPIIKTEETPETGYWQAPGPWRF